jgi:hypothetical protein
MRGDGRNQLQIPAPLPLKNIFQMIQLSISFDSPFNIYNLFQKEKYDISTMEKIAVAE